MTGVMNNLDGNMLKFQSQFMALFMFKDGRQRDPSFTSKFCKTD